MLSAMVLGADAVQMGSVFIASNEASAHQNFKNEVIKAKEGATHLALKKLVPVRLILNLLAIPILKEENKGASKEELMQLLGKGKAKLGMFEGNIEDGELEIGQISALIKNIKPVRNIIDDIILEYKTAKAQINHVRFEF